MSESLYVSITDQLVHGTKIVTADGRLKATKPSLCSAAVAEALVNGTAKAGSDQTAGATDKMSALQLTLECNAVST